MSLSIDPLQTLDITPTPAMSNTVPSIELPPGSAPFISLMESLRRAKAALPDEDSIDPEPFSDPFGPRASTGESSRASGGFGDDLKLCASERSGVQGLALTFDAIPDRVASLNVRPILRSSMSSEVSDMGEAASSSSERPASKRRSSRVRFSDELLPSAKSSPGLMALKESGSVESIMLPPVKEAAASPISPMFGRKAKQLRQRSSTSSLYNSRRSSGTSLSSESADSPCKSRFSSQDMFKPQPLPYRKLEKVLARLSTESGASESSEQSVRRRRSTPSSLRSSVVDGSVGRASVFSVKSSNASYSRPCSPIELTDNVPAINRQEWCDAFGISPRSQPTPIAPDMHMFDEVVVPDYPPPDIPLPPPPENRLSISSFSSLQVHKGHERYDSGNSIEMVFPLPPQRDIEVKDVEADRAPSAASVQVEAGCENRSRPTSRRTSRGGPRSPSPAVSDVMAQALEMLRRRKSSVYPYTKEDDSDIDIDAPLEEVALKSRILSPNSRLLKGSKGTSRRSSLASVSIASLRSGVVLTSGKGWSGSESEEEEWSTTSRLQVRRVRKAIPSAFRPPPLRPTWAKQEDRLSSQSTSTMDSVSTASTALMTPSVSTEGVPTIRRMSSEMGTSRFGWKPAPAPKLRRASSSVTVLPTPTREVEGWGAPEKMLDEPVDELPEVLEHSMSSSHVTTPVSKYFYAGAADLEDRLAGLIGRLPSPRVVSEPTKKQHEAVSVKAPKIAARHSQLQLKQRVVSEDPQCAACRFF